MFQGKTVPAFVVIGSLNRLKQDDQLIMGYGGDENPRPRAFVG
jgi:hypothetical protein